MDQVYPPVHRHLAVVEVGPEQCRGEPADTELAHQQAARIDFVESDAEAVADDAAGSVAADEKPRANPAGLPGCGGSDDGVDAVAVLGERGQGPAEPDVDVLRAVFQQPFERRFEHDL